MGKGKRNRLLHIEDNTGAPKKQQNKAKKQIVWPVWAKRALCIALLVAVLAGIIVAAVISGGTILRNRILVESKTGKYDMNQQMATFVLWYLAYQQGYQQGYYLGSYFAGNNGITDPDQVEAYAQQYGMQYALSQAADQTKLKLNSGLNDIKDYLIELVAGADAAEKEGLKFNANDKASVQDIVSEIQNIYIVSGHSSIPFKNFLAEYVGDSFKTSDIEAAAKVMIMCSKYTRFVSFGLQDDPDENALKDYILKNPAGFFETKYYLFNNMDTAFIRKHFSDEFMAERFESTIAKYYANIDRLAIMDLKDEALTAKLKELGLDTATEYTKTTTDGKDTYSPDTLPEAIGEYIFSTANKAGNFAAISGDKCAYLVYFKENASATKATIAYKEYQYETCKDKLVADFADVNFETIDMVKAELLKSIIAGENLTDFLTDNEKAEDKYDELIDAKAPANAELPAELNPEKVNTFNPADKNVTNTAPQSILDKLYAKDTTVNEGWHFVINNDTESYLVKVIKVEMTEDNKKTTDYTISYATFHNDLFAGVLETFEAEFTLYLLESKVEAPTYTMKFDDLKKEIITWLMDENYYELAMTKVANDDYKKLLESNKETLQQTLNDLFGENGVVEFTNSYATKKTFETTYDSKVYDYIFNSKNADSSQVIVGEDHRVFLVYVAPAHEENEEGHEGHDHSNTVSAAIKEYKYEDYIGSEQFTYTFEKDGKEESKDFYQAIYDDLSASGRKNTTTYKSADDLAKAELDGLNNDPTTWKPEQPKPITATKPVDKNDSNTLPSVILNKIYDGGSKATEIALEADKYYQVDDNGTSYVFKITEIVSDSKTLECKVEYVTFNDAPYYSYFRAIKSKLESTFSESSSTLKYPDSITEGSYQDWLFKGEYKAAENDTPAEHKFDRVKEDLTFIANVDSKNVVTSLTMYLIDEPATQKNNEDMTVYASYQLYETEKEAQKALKKLNGLTGSELLDAFSALKHREEDKLSGFVSTISPMTGVDLTKADVTDDNLEKWLFDENRAANNVEIIAATTKDGKSAGYYLAVFFSTEQAWLRDARTGWVNEALTDQIDELVKDYKFNEEAMEKIEDAPTTTTASTTTAPKA